MTSTLPIVHACVWRRACVYVCACFKCGAIRPVDWREGGVWEWVYVCVRCYLVLCDWPVCSSKVSKVLAGTQSVGGEAEVLQAGQRAANQPVQGRQPVGMGVQTFSVPERFPAGISDILLALSTSSSNLENFSRSSSRTDTWTQQGFKLVRCKLLKWNKIYIKTISGRVW